MADYPVKIGKATVNITEGGITNAEVIAKVEQLPTATADSPDFVQTLDGTFYRKKAVESGGLTGTWVFNDTVSLSPVTGLNPYEISFISNNNTYISIEVKNSGVGYTGSGTPSITAYDALLSSWTDTAYKTIQITDISSLTNVDEFTQWLTANATGGGTSVSYEYVSVGNEVVDLGSFTETTPGTENITDGFYYSGTISDELFNKLQAGSIVSVTCPVGTFKFVLNESGGSYGSSVDGVDIDNQYERASLSIGSNYKDVNIGFSLQNKIPTPAESDNGKVLGVTNGAYALQEASGGGGGISITFDSSVNSVSYIAKDGTTKTANGGDTVTDLSIITSLIPSATDMGVASCKGVNALYHRDGQNVEFFSSATDIPLTYACEIIPLNSGTITAKIESGGTGA